MYKPNPRLKQDPKQGPFLREVLLAWIQFSFSLTDCLTKAKEFSLPFYLSKARRRIDAFMLFPGVLA